MAVVTYLDAISQALREEMRRDPTVFLMGEDIGVFGGAFKITRGFVEEFGEERLAQLLSEHREAPAEETIQTVLEAISDWTEAAEPEDDITLIIVRRIPAG